VPDIYGWYNNIISSVDTAAGHSAQQPKTKAFASQNADNYAWMAVSEEQTISKPTNKYTGIQPLQFT